MVTLQVPTPSIENVDVESIVIAPDASMSNVVESMSIGLSAFEPIAIA